MAQSRPKPNPRPLRFRNQMQPPLIIPVWQDQDTGAQIVHLLFSEPVSVVAGGLVLEGADVPNFTIYRDGSGLTYGLTKAELATDFLSLELTFEAGAMVTADACIFTLPAWGLTYRNAQGGYVAPMRYDFVCGV